MRRVTIRDERHGSDSRHLAAYLDRCGNLHIDGHDLGPGTAMVSDDGEYEWFTVYPAEHVPTIIALLDGDPDTDILDLLAAQWTGAYSYELERRLRDSDIPVRRSVWS